MAVNIIVVITTVESLGSIAAQGIVIVDAVNIVPVLGVVTFALWVVGFDVAVEALSATVYWSLEICT